MRKIFLTTLLVIMMSAATALAASWTQIYTDDNDDEIFFDTDSVSISSMTENRDEVTFSAQFRMNYSEKGRQALINWYRDYSIMPQDIQSLAYDVTTINFRKIGDKRVYYISERKSYTASGRLLEDMHFVNTNPTWEEVPVASVVDVEYFNAFLIVDGKKFEPNY
ncbi:MAG: hypothetical protein IKT98_09375 [Selenomonadaceae bacterium]|nr:hypothetical protein [Selenomonadaceae bacterium]